MFLAYVLLTALRRVGFSGAPLGSAKQVMAGDFEQRTLQRTVTVEGVGLHSGANVTLRLVPAPANSGLAFVRVDLPNRPVIAVRSENVVDTSLATTLGVGGVKVATVEHVLAAVVGLGVDNLRIEIDGPEVPIVDGSAEPFVRAMVEAGTRRQGEGRRFLVMRKSVTVTDGDKVATLAPSRSLKIDCTIDFKHPLISDQRATLELKDATHFLREIARARTFGFLRDVDRLRAMGLARGGSIENAVVIDDFSILNPEGLRYPDEFARHKLLDTLGDIATLGAPVLGALTAHKTGHALNQKLVAKVLADASSYEFVTARLRSDAAGQLELDEVPAFAPSAA